MAAAVMLLGFSIIYGTTGNIQLVDIGAILDRRVRLAARAGSLPVAIPRLLLGVVIFARRFCVFRRRRPIHAYAVRQWIRAPQRR